MHYTDHLHRKIILPNPPERIISLVPSQTELLIELGLEQKLVGVTKFCVHPKHIRKEKTIVGGTKNYRMDVIESLRPDLIIGNKEENEQEGIRALSEKWPVWMSDIFTLQDAYRMILDIGELTSSLSKAKDLVQKIENSLQNPIPRKGTCVYLIWENPTMAAGKNTFIHEMLNMAGFENLINGERYPEIDLEYLKELNPEFLLLSSEPFPFKEKHLTYYRENLPTTQVMLIDGEMFSWYGSRLQYSGEYFRSL